MGQVIRNVEAKLLPQAVIAGRVTDAEGEPVQAAKVELVLHQYTQEGHRRFQLAGRGGLTNDLGEYRIFDVPPGKYLVEVIARNRVPMLEAVLDQSAEEPTPMITFHPSTTDPGQATAIGVRAGTTHEGVDLQVRYGRSYRVSGQVESPLPGPGMILLIPVSGSTAELQQQRVSIREGRFVLNNVLPGSYRVIAEFFSHPRRSSASDVEVHDRNVENVQIVLQPPFEIPSGLRTDGGGTIDFSRVSVSLRPRDPVGPFSAASGGRATADGKIAIHVLSPGHYDVIATGFPEDYFVRSIPVGETDALEEGARIEPGSRLEIVVSPRGGRITGNVTNDKGDAVTWGKAVLISSKGMRSNHVRAEVIDQQGRFKFSGLAPGDYFLAAVEDTVSNSYWDPEFPTRHGNLVEKVSIREGATENKTVKIIPGTEP